MADKSNLEPLWRDMLAMLDLCGQASSVYEHVRADYYRVQARLCDALLATTDPARLRASFAAFARSNKIEAVKLARAVWPIGGLRGAKRYIDWCLQDEVAEAAKEKDND